MMIPQVLSILQVLFAPSERAGSSALAVPSTARQPFDQIGAALGIAVVGSCSSA